MRLLELLIASALLTTIALGILPLFVRSVADNNRGWEGTLASNHAATALENVLDEPLQDQQANSTEVFSEGALGEIGDPAEGWRSGLNATNVSWERKTNLRSLRVRDLPPWPGSETPWTPTPREGVAEIQEVRVTLLSARQGGFLGAGQRLTIPVFKAF